MNKKDLIKEYRELKNSEAPDLWNRIEQNLDTVSSADSVNGISQEQPDTTVPGKILPFKKFNKIIFSSAAVILVVLVASAVINSSFLQKATENIRIPNSDGKYSGNFAADINKSEDTVNPDGSTDRVEEYASQVPQTTTTPAMTTTTATPSYIASEDSTLTPNETNSSTEDFNRGDLADLPAAYNKLDFASIKPVSLPTLTAPMDAQAEYFTMEAFADTNLLIQATVKDILFLYNDRGEAHSVVYTVSADMICFNEGGYPTVGTDNGTPLLMITSPIVQADDTWMYPLQINRTYLLPLNVTSDDTVKLIFPYAPQIELSLDGFCVFHSGWQALITNNTGHLQIDSIHPEDYYYDRMMIRENNGFARDLTRLIKSLK